MKSATENHDVQAFLNTISALSEYRAISDECGTRCAERSGVPLINHINQGIAIICALGEKLPDGRSFGRMAASAGYCLHPLFQNDENLHTVGRSYAHSARNYFAGPVMLAMEYRWRANNWLSDKVRKDERKAFPARQGPIDFDVVWDLDGQPDAGQIPEIHAMLIADKVQNYKDFLIYHSQTHARSAELDVYFRTWLQHLGVDEFTFHDLREAARSVEP